MCGVVDCDKPINRDGVCLLHKLRTVRANVRDLKREREGTDATGGMGTQAFVNDMYEKRRSLGVEDPVPENSKAARYAPRRKVTEGGYI
jgi:hypothetical protein